MAEDQKPPGPVAPDAIAPRATFETTPETHMQPAAPVMTLAQRRLEVVRRADERIRRKASRIVDAVADAARLDDSGLPVDGTRIDQHTKRPEGWSGVRYRVALDSRLPERMAPGYLKHILRVHESYQRVEAAKPAAPELGAGVQVFVQNNTYNYPVKDVTEASAAPDPTAGRKR